MLNGSINNNNNNNNDNNNNNNNDDVVVSDHFILDHVDLELLEIEALNYIKSHGNSLEAAMFSAACEGNYSIVMCLAVLKEFNVDCRDDKGNTPLHYAVLNNKLAMVNMLLSYNAIPFICNHEGNTPLDLASHHAEYPNFSIITSIENASDGDTKQDPSLKAIYDLMLNMDILDIKDTSAPYDKPNLLDAIHDNDDNLAHELISAGCDLETPNSKHFTPLLTAIHKKNASITKKIITTYAKTVAKDSNAKEKIGKFVNTITNDLSAMHLACMTKRFDIIPFLIKYHADVNILDQYGLSPLHVAVNFWHKEAIEVLLSHGALINQHDRNGNTPLHVAVHNYGTDMAMPGNAMNPEVKKEFDHIIHLLLTAPPSAKMNINATNNVGITPLYTAVSTGQTFLCAMLIHCNANVNQACDNGKTPLHLAAAKGFHEIVGLLVALKGITQLNAQNDSGTTALGLATHLGHVQCVQKLIQAGADVNLPGYMGIVPLHSAAAVGHKEIVQLLLNAKADPTLKDLSGMTAQMHAGDNTEIVDLLNSADILYSQRNFIRQYSAQDKTVSMSQMPPTEAFTPVGQKLIAKKNKKK